MSEQDWREKRRKEDEAVASLLRRAKEVHTLDDLLGLVRDAASMALVKHVEQMNK